MKSSAAAALFVVVDMSLLPGVYSFTSQLPLRHPIGRQSVASPPSITLFAEKQGNPFETSDNYDDREKVTLPGNRTIRDVDFEVNADGTRTYFPKTTVKCTTPGYEVPKTKLQEEHLISNEPALHSSAVLPDAMLEGWKEAVDLFNSLNPFYALKKTNTRFVFVATRHFEEEEVVAEAHASIGYKSLGFIAETSPAIQYASCIVTLDICQGKSEDALRQVLAAVYDFFETWKSIQKQEDRKWGKYHNGNFLSCSYRLQLPVAASDDDCGDEWIRPTEEMYENWEYERLDETLYYGCPEGAISVVVLKLKDY